MPITKYSKPVQSPYYPGYIPLPLEEIKSAAGKMEAAHNSFIATGDGLDTARAQFQVDNRGYLKPVADQIFANARDEINALAENSNGYYGDLDSKARSIGRTMVNRLSSIIPIKDNINAELEQLGKTNLPTRERAIAELDLRGRATSGNYIPITWPDMPDMVKTFQETIKRIGETTTNSPIQFDSELNKLVWVTQSNTDPEAANRIIEQAIRTNPEISAFLQSIATATARVEGKSLDDAFKEAFDYYIKPVAESVIEGIPVSTSINMRDMGGEEGSSKTQRDIERAGFLSASGDTAPVIGNIDTSNYVKARDSIRHENSVLQTRLKKKGTLNPAETELKNTLSEQSAMFDAIESRAERELSEAGQLPATAVKPERPSGINQTILNAIENPYGIGTETINGMIQSLPENKRQEALDYRTAYSSYVGIKDNYVNTVNKKAQEIYAREHSDYVSYVSLTPYDTKVNNTVLNAVKRRIETSGDGSKIVIDMGSGGESDFTPEMITEGDGLNFEVEDISQIIPNHPAYGMPVMIAKVRQRGEESASKHRTYHILLPGTNATNPIAQLLMNSSDESIRQQGQYMVDGLSRRVLSRANMNTAIPIQKEDGSRVALKDGTAIGVIKTSDGTYSIVNPETLAPVVVGGNGRTVERKTREQMAEVLRLLRSQVQ